MCDNSGQQGYQPQGMGYRQMSPSVMQPGYNQMDPQKLPDQSMGAQQPWSGDAPSMPYGGQSWSGASPAMSPQGSSLLGNPQGGQMPASPMGNGMPMGGAFNPNAPQQQGQPQSGRNPYSPQGPQDGMEAYFKNMYGQFAYPGFAYPPKLR